MRARVAYGLFVVASCALLTGCGKLDFFGESREPWRDAAEAQCLRAGGLQPSPFAQPLPRIDQKMTCGLEHPFRVSALEEGRVSIQPSARIGCPMNVALNKWMREVVQPAAFANFGQPVIGIKNIASYGCRTRNNKKGAKLSEHSFGNALDIKAFFLADGTEVDIRRTWYRGTPQQKAFLRQAHGGACGTFKTVLGPGSDGYHEDHFHFDLARHDPAGQRAYCRPVPKQVPNAPPPPRYIPQPDYYPPEVSQAPQPYPYPPHQTGYTNTQQPTYGAYPQQAQPDYGVYAPQMPMSYAPAQTWPIARVPTPYAKSAEDASDQ